MAGTNFVGIANGIDSAAHMVSVAHTKADTGSDIDYVGTVEADMVLAWVHLGPIPHYSLSMCRPSFPSRVDMFDNLSIHALLICKIYKTCLLGYLQYFAGIGIPRRDVL